MTVMLALLSILTVILVLIGHWLYRRGGDREKLEIVEVALEAEQRRERVNAEVARMDDAGRADALKPWLRDGRD